MPGLCCRRLASSLQSCEWERSGSPLCWALMIHPEEMIFSNMASSTDDQVRLREVELVDCDGGQVRKDEGG